MELVQKTRATLGRQGAHMVAFKAARYPFKRFLVPRAIRDLREAGAASATAADHIRVVRSFNSGGIAIPAWQVVDEITPLLEQLEQEPPRAVLEVGTAQGGLLYLFARVAADDALLMSIDLPGGAFGGSYARYRAPLYESFARAEQRVELLRDDSHSPRALEAVRSTFADRPLDLLFIDGDHSYDGVKRDYEMYAPLVRPGGIVAFHDIVPGAPESVGGVPDFWQEIKQGREHVEYVDDWNRGSCGIGVLHA